MNIAPSLFDLEESPNVSPTEVRVLANEMLRKFRVLVQEEINREEPMTLNQNSNHISVSLEESDLRSSE